MFQPFLTVLLLLSCSITYLQYDRVRLTDIDTLTFYKNGMTNSRRTKPIPQLQCIGGRTECMISLDEVTCDNAGVVGHDVKWKCVASLPKRYKFGKLNVNCEGYNYPTDPYVLAGSCGLQYTLEYNEHLRHSQGHDSNSRYYLYRRGHEKTFVSSATKLLFIGTLLYMSYKILPWALSSIYNLFANGFQSDPPPSMFNPHDDRSYFMGYGSPFRNPFGGFLSGLGLGALGGYYFGNRGYRNPPTYGWHDDIGFAGSYRKEEEDDSYRGSGFASTTRR